MKTLRNTFGALCVILLAATAGAASTKPTGTILQVGGDKPITGEIQWSNRDKGYRVTIAMPGGKGTSTTTISADNVQSLKMDKPAGYDALVKQVEAGKGAQAIAGLEKIADAYEHLQYDVMATRWLAVAYLAQGKARDAVSACEKVIRNNPDAAYSGEMAPAYWEALRKTNSGNKLQGLLDKAIASGDTSAAAALVARGDAALGADDAAASTAANCQIALRDGYLRVILLYADPSSEAYPEALYKGAQAFKKMGQASRANRLLDTLKAEPETLSQSNRGKNNEEDDDGSGGLRPYVRRGLHRRLRLRAG